MSPLSLPASQTTRHSVAISIRRNILPSFKDLIAFALSVFLAFELRFEGAIPSKYFHACWVGLCIWAATKTIVFSVSGVNRGHWRYTSVYDAQRIATANSLGSFVGGLVILALLGPWTVPRSIYILEWIISCFLILGSRLVSRVVATAQNSRWAEKVGTRTLIYGAGAAGLHLLRELRQNRSLMSDVVGFIDDDQSKTGLVLDGKKVLGTGPSLAGLIEKYSIKRLLIAIPSSTGSQMVRILNLAADTGVEYKMVPGLGDLIQGKELGGQIRDIAVEDLLGRQSVKLNQESIRGRLQGKTVMVTGAGGSIGSELCRQISLFHPKALIGFDAAETALFQIDRELHKSFPDLAFHPEIGDVTNAQQLHRVMERYQPSVVYHAAAYKHVSLMEKHVFAAIENNILGTWRTATVAMKNGVEDFVLISTDKAVRPTSMMGATKRVAELAIRALQIERGTRFVAVRFGNVLGSNGSVVPIFKEQIAAGGPVTVTDPEMRRYFMTIPEAAQLVLQAFSLGKGGDVFLLDMGEPVKIVDLARNLILLSGLKPDKDIEIQFTGLRPGEKLYEELNLHDESLLPTLHSKIRRYAAPSTLDASTVRRYLRELEHTVANRDVSKLLELLKNLVPDYTPSSQVLNAAVPSKSEHLILLDDRFPIHSDSHSASAKLIPAPNVH